MGPQLERLVPLVVSYCGLEDDELREHCLQGLESLLRRCPKELAPHVPTVRERSLCPSKGIAETCRTRGLESDHNVPRWQGRETPRGLI